MTPGPIPSVVDPVPVITTDQMREVDRVMIEDLGIELLQMMENAGRGLARLALARDEPASVTVLAGPGGNGGGGMAAARHLANLGVEVSVTLSASELTGVPAHQAAILERMGVSFAVEPPPADLIIDALIGYGLRGDPRGRTANLIEHANGASSPILSLDTPSGLDTTTGMVGDPCIRADATMTLALPKRGLAARRVVGDLYLADISVPPSVYRPFGIEAHRMFAQGAVVRVERLDLG